MEIEIKDKMQVLSKVLEEEKSIGKSEYTLELGGLCPCGMGMACIDGAWYTYSCERGEKFDFNKFFSFDDAAHDLMEMVAPDNETFCRMRDKYKRASLGLMLLASGHKTTAGTGRVAAYGKVAIKPAATTGRVAAHGKVAIKPAAATGRVAAHGKVAIKPASGTGRAAVYGKVAKLNKQKEGAAVRGKKGMDRINKGIAAKTNPISGRGKNSSLK